MSSMSKELLPTVSKLFIRLLFPVKCEVNKYGKPKEKPEPNVSSISPEQLKIWLNSEIIEDHRSI